MKSPNLVISDRSLRAGNVAPIHEESGEENAIIQVQYLKTCPVCLSEDSRAKRVRSNYLLMNCRCCLSSFEPLSHSSSEKIYCAAYYTSQTEVGYADYAADQRKNRRTFIYRLRRLKQLVPQASSILDIGCAFGETLKIAKEMGFTKAVGIEVSEFCIKKTRSEGLEVYSPDEFERIHQATKFEVITMQDVLEHTIYPVEMLSNAIRRLSENGVLFISTPDIHSLSHQLLGKAWYHYKPTEHRVYFCHDSLHFALVRAGFSQIEIQSDLSYMAIERIAQRLEKYAPRFFSAVRSMLIHSGLGNITLPIRIGNINAIARR